MQEQESVNIYCATAIVFLPLSRDYSSYFPIYHGITVFPLPRNILVCHSTGMAVD